MMACFYVNVKSEFAEHTQGEESTLETYVCYFCQKAVISAKEV